LLVKYYEPEISGDLSSSPKTTEFDPSAGADSGEGTGAAGMGSTEEETTGTEGGAGAEGAAGRGSSNE